jgi:drug/metabolite transporter (DMT)-like permease
VTSPGERPHRPFRALGCNYVQLLGAASTGYLIFGDVPGPELWLGALLIVASGLSIAYAETRRPATG